MFCLRNYAMLAIWLAMSATCLFAQSTRPLFNAVQKFSAQGGRFERVNLFYPVVQENDAANAFAPSAQFLLLDPDYLKKEAEQYPKAISLRLPFNGSVLIVDLLEAPVSTQDFSVFSSFSPDHPEPYAAAQHYRGIIRGDDKSLAAVSFCKGEIMGLIVNDQLGNLVLGKIDNADNKSAYILYADRDLTVRNPYTCTALETGESKSNSPATDNPAADACVRVYFEADYELFQNKGSVQNTVDYLSAVFNQVATLYANEQISTMLSEIFVWTTPDNYSTSSSSTALKEFRSLRKNFNGDLAHLVGIGGKNLGGIAYLDVLCAPSYAYAFSDINTSYATVPTFSWTVEVLTHEMGHNLGSPHTQSCSWPGGAIDNCFTTEGSCSPGPAPVNGGTIMSYCHLTNYGINFNHGFGPLPGNKIRTEVANAACLSGTCAGSGNCEAPSGISITNITSNSATVNWNNVSNAGSYALQWRVVGNTTWTTVQNVVNPFVLSGLPNNSTIEIRLQSHCSASDSAFSQGMVFSTTGTGGNCETPLGLSTTPTSATVAKVTWQSVLGASEYQITFKKSSASTWSAPIFSANTSYNLSGLSANTNYTVRVVAICGNGSSNYAYSTFMTPSGGGATACGLPGNFSATAITSNTAQLIWDAVPGAVYYQLRFKLASSYYFGSAIYVSSPGYLLSGLAANTTYHVLVRTLCSLNASPYQIIQFTTTDTGGPGATCPTPENFSINNVSASSAVIGWDPVAAATGYDLQVKLPNSNYWLTFSNITATAVQITNLKSKSLYQVRVRTRCSGSQSYSPYSQTLDINTLGIINPGSELPTSWDPKTYVLDLSKGGKYQDDVSAFPNPTTGLLTVNFLLNAESEVELELRDPNGRLLETKTRVSSSEGQVDFDLQSLPNGVYFVRVFAANQPPIVKQIVKI